ncbi:MAG TPA: TonB-dependent receptor, partial [Longimicrobiales bacterium]
FGRWSPPGLASSRFFDTHGLSYNDADGGILLTTPLVRDSAYLTVGVEGRHTERPLAALWADGTGSDLLPVARSFGVDLSSYAHPRVARTEAISAFSRLDWQASDRQAVDARVVLTRIPFADDGQTALLPMGAAPTYDGTDVVASAGIRSVLGESTANEFRVGFDASSRTFGAGDSTGNAAPLAIVASPALGFGAGPATTGLFSNSTLRMRETLLYDVGSQHLRFGLDASSTAYREDYRYGAAGVFLYGGVSDFAAGRGLFVQRTGPAPDARFTIGRYALFLEDAWSTTAGLDVVLGLRAEREQLPRSGVAADSTWLRLTGLANDALPKSRFRISPRASLRWDVQNQHLWVVNAGAMLGSDPTDPAVYGELINQDGATRVRRGVGSLSAWPSLPSSVQAPDVGPVLSLMSTSYKPPRTARVSGGISRRLGAAAALDISGLYRHTDFLPVRSDLNLVSSPAAQDQYGRPIFGKLQQVGSLLAAVPGSDRRFSTYDAVWALSSSAHSDYYGGTVALHGRVAGADLLASYTYSSTRDNWSSGWSAPVAPLATTGTGGSAADAPADFDVPQRFVLGASMRGPLGAHLSALYRYRSGLPFTPGFAAGVDANADGSAGNDPAFIDTALPGMSALLSRWSCLSAQQGKFATRNSCRAPGVQSLDARAALDLFKFNGRAVQVTFDGLGLFESDTGILDTALLQVDPAGALTGNHVPLAVNPRFGSVLARQAPGRIFRVGLSFNW